MRTHPSNQAQFNRKPLIFILCALLGLLNVKHPQSVNVQAQENLPVLIEGTVQLSDALSAAVTTALAQAQAEAEIDADVFAATDISEQGDWLYVSVVGLKNIPDSGEWNVVDHGTWFTHVLVQQPGATIRGAAVYQSASYAALLADEGEALQFAPDPVPQTADPESFIFPFRDGYSVRYGSLGIHDGWGDWAVDLGSDGNIAAGHVPNELITAAAGTVNYRCSPNLEKGETTGVIKVGDFLYAHLVEDTIISNMGDQLPQGAYLGMLETGDFKETCGWGSQGADWFHVHFEFLGLPLTLGNWTLTYDGVSTWSNGTETRGTNEWLYIDLIHQVDLKVRRIVFNPVEPQDGEPFLATMRVINRGNLDLDSPFTVDLYVDRQPVVCGDLGDYSTTIPNLPAGETIEVEFSLTGLSVGTHEIHAYVDTECLVDESDEDNEYGPDLLNVTTLTHLFSDGFETGDFSLWSRFNDGSGYLFPCAEAAINGGWGACVDRGNDKRKQLIDESPVDQTMLNVRFNLDLNSLSMGEGTRFRFVQTKMGAERPFFIVLKYQNGLYQIQLNTLLDDLTKVKTGWYTLTDAPHVVEVGWQAASAPEANDGSAALYIDGLRVEKFSDLDNDEIFIDTFKTGFTSRLDDKIISGIFYLDDIATSNSGYIGLP